MHSIVYGSKKKQQTIIQAKHFVNIEAQRCVRQAQRVHIETNQLIWTVHNASRRVANRNLASWSFANRSKESFGDTQEIHRLTPAGIERRDAQKDFYPKLRATANIGKVEWSGARHHRSRRNSPVGRGARRTSGPRKRNGPAAG